MYVVENFLACIFVVLATVGISFIHPFVRKSSLGGGGMLTSV